MGKEIWYPSVLPISQRENEARIRESEEGWVHYVGWGGGIRKVKADFELGRGIYRGGTGPRGLIWDAAYGYVSGFRLRDITYYLLTRSLSKRVWKLSHKWEYRKAERKLRDSND